MQTSYVVMLRDERQLEEARQILKENHLELDKLSEMTFGIVLGTEVVGTASVYGQTICSVALKKKRQGSNDISELIEACISFIYGKGYDNVFVFTTPEGEISFKRMGFFTISRSSEGFVLMERSPIGLEQYVQSLETLKIENGVNGAIVMNANPFTLGHQYLAEYAAADCDHLFIWVVEEDASAFPYEDRIELVRQGTSHLENVTVLPGGKYTISRATFPSYFSQSEPTWIKRHAELDLHIFAERFAKVLNISKRYVGTEPYCEVTNQYNEIMKVVLESCGVKVVEIPRKTIEDKAVSASSVRACLLANDFEGLKRLLPSTTLSYLNSERGKYVVKTRLEAGKRH